MRLVIADTDNSAAQSMAELVKSSFPDDETIVFGNKGEAISYIRRYGCGVLFVRISRDFRWGYELAENLCQNQQRINVVFFSDSPECAVEAFNVYAVDYLITPVERRLQKIMENLRYPTEKNRVFLQCFGNFEVFVNGTPLRFPRAKAKEILAYLADRRGAECSMGQLISVLWEDGEDTPSRSSNLRNAIGCLKKTLDSVGAGDIIVKTRNSIRLDTKAVDCDYFDYIDKKASDVHNFRREYMLQYSWSEITAGRLVEE